MKRAIMVTHQAIWNEPGAEGNLGNETIIRLIYADGEEVTRRADLEGLVCPANPSWPVTGIWRERVHAVAGVMELELSHPGAGMRLRLRRRIGGYQALSLSQRQVLAKEAITIARSRRLSILPMDYELRESF